MSHTVRYRYLLFAHLSSTARDACAFARDRFVRPAKPVSDPRLHMTIARLAERDDPDPLIGPRVVEAFQGVELPGFDIGLDRIRMNPDIAMLQGKGNRPALVPLRQPVRDRLPRAGILPYISRTEPHVTLGYEIGRNDCQPIEPIRWIADRLDLVESWAGRTVHRTLASWPLVNRQLSFGF
ncbi:2'-5' RNA ligase family protein [Sphingomonas sanxanigenens]|uniref:2'-5' RNA ligase n=1 Tax=Sphingomonas sanxanigenens DSM 19645 = NX02 TaxID=1123269 RepID=W0AML6_9SPHN|nr:hypothetical protein [Sphingomonas sanxanigenens]AHE56955.1 hypothetical protein NX02_26830 [Sphingomonas sanxanigenens DSM 19645 = NX02]